MRDKWGPFQLSTFTKALHMDHTALCTPFIQTIIDISIKVSGILMKYRPFWCNIDHKFKNIDHLSKIVDYRPMVDNIDPVAALQKTSLNVIIQPISNPFKAFGCAYSQKKAILSPKGHFCAVLGFPSDPPGCVWQYSTMFKHFSTQLGLLGWPLAKKYHLGQ